MLVNHLWIEFSSILQRNHLYTPADNNAGKMPGKKRKKDEKSGVSFMDTKDSVQLFSISHARLRSNQYFLLMVAHISASFYAVHHTSLQILLLDG